MRSQTRPVANEHHETLRLDGSLGVVCNEGIHSTRATWQLNRRAADSAIHWLLNGASLVAAAFTLIAALLVGADAYGQDSTRPGQDAGVEGLRQGSFPWYDEETDDLKRADVSPNDDDFEGRHSDWSRQRKPKAPTGGGGARTTAFSQAMEVFIWLSATLLLAALISLLVWALINNANRGVKGEDTFGELEAPIARIDRVEELPVPVQAMRGDLLAQAKHHYANNNLRDAIICLFSYKLIQLDNHHAIHLERGKTNRQYLRELRQSPELRRQLEGTMIAFEDVFFGNHSLTRERFESCLARVDDFQRALQESAR